VSCNFDAAPFVDKNRPSAAFASIWRDRATTVIADSNNAAPIAKVGFSLQLVLRL